MWTLSLFLALAAAIPAPPSTHHGKNFYQYFSSEPSLSVMLEESDETLPVLPGVREHVFLEWEGINRTYVIYTPSTVSATVAAPLMFVVHFAGGSPSIIATVTTMDAVAEEGAFYTVYPRGTDRTFNAGPSCCGNQTRDDVGFFLAIMADVATRKNVDWNRVYSCGQRSLIFHIHLHKSFE
eukprot:TRINITY_DN1130_c0_g1_i2.p1 TRINITY_DN1130_c0_g1~~TRINITY_DN1130_c0_g1_i2.p1  ORF type:complete len:181 (-),score=27.21 TRINITY_DN1130_c0_g1_i2:569-1111(-)